MVDLSLIVGWWLLRISKNVSNYENEYGQIINVDDLELSVAEDIELGTAVSESEPSSSSQVDDPADPAEQHDETDGPTKRRLLPADFDEQLRQQVVMQDSDFVATEPQTKVEELLRGMCRIPDCCGSIEVVQSKVVGCVVICKWECSSGHTAQWESSKQIRRSYVDNLLAATSVLISGNSINKI